MKTAAFLIAPVRGLPEFRLAATTRPTEPGRIGLPGGKAEPGEDAAFTLLREAAEEGFYVRASLYYVHSDFVDEYMVHWYAAPEAIRLAKYKEQGRVLATDASLSQVARSGYGNAGAILALSKKLHAMLRHWRRAGLAIPEGWNDAAKLLTNKRA